jgi:hypothetical protein
MVDDVRADVRQIRDDVNELVAQGAAHTTILADHMEQLKTLNTKMEIALVPIALFKSLLKLCAGLSILAGFSWGIIKAVMFVLLLIGGHSVPNA